MVAFLPDSASSYSPAGWGWRRWWCSRLMIGQDKETWLHWTFVPVCDLLLWPLQLHLPPGQSEAKSTQASILSYWWTKTLNHQWRHHYDSRVTCGRWYWFCYISSNRFDNRGDTVTGSMCTCCHYLILSWHFNSYSVLFYLADLLCVYACVWCVWCVVGLQQTVIVIVD